MSVALILDLILVAMIALTAWKYYRKGFIAGVLDLTGSLFSLFAAWAIAQRMAPRIFSSFIHEPLVKATSNALQTKGGTSLTSIVESMAGILPQELSEKINELLTQLLQANTPNTAVQIVDQVLQPIIIPLVMIVLFFITFAICKMIVALIVGLLVQLNKIPLLGGFNRSVGAVVGVLVGVVNAGLTLCVIWGIVALSSNNLPLLNDVTLSGSWFYRLFLSYNLFIS